MPLPDRLTAALAGRYRIDRELGQGGMATVYLAQDLKHDRKVALKVLKPELAAVLGAERFVVEIKTTAALQHPHILPLFDSGTADGFLFYVMPFIEGETLRDKLNREHQFGVDEALRITREVADALDYAHRHGVIHRDIKPENILLHDGRPMVADFGIALALSAAAGGRMTETGLSLGTPHYMSPEQATAEKEITGRSDVYSLASVLYEMLSGEPPHTGKSAQQIIMKIIAEPVKPVSEWRKAVPPHVVDAVSHALEKLPADRFASAAEFAAALGNPAYTLPGLTAATGAGVRSRGRARWDPLTVGLAGVAAAASLAALWFATRPLEAPPPVIGFALELTVPITDLGGSPLALSPDGSRLVVAAQTIADPQVRLYLRSLDGTNDMVLANTENTIQPFFSPDGAWVAYWSNGALRRVSIAGGTVFTLMPVSGGFQGGAWSARGDIIVATNGMLLRTGADGGTVDTLLRDSTASHRWPEILPDGETVLFMTAGAGPSRIQAMSLRSRRVTDLGITGTYPRYVGRGWLVYGTNDGVLFAAPFDPERVRVLGAAIPVTTNVRSGAGGAMKLGTSRNGMLAWLGGAAASRELVLVDATGRERSTGTPPDLYESPRFSPDGLRVAVGVGELLGGRPDVWSLDLAQNTLGRVTYDSASVYPEWSPDGKWVHFATSRSGDYDLWRSRSDGSGVEEPVVIGPNDQWEGVPSADGRGVVFRVTDPTTRRDVWWLPTGAREAVPVLVTPFEERGIAPSPDGRWLAYVSNETGADEIYVRALPGPGGRVQISASGGREPRWGAAGRELLFRARDSVFATPITIVEGEVRAGRTRALFRDAYRLGGAGNHAGWDVDRSGRRFVFVRDAGANAERRVNFMLNWFDQPRATAAAVMRRD
ncbi:MAG: protein kinase [Gemmatimonadaceae bacterium]